MTLFKKALLYLGLSNNNNFFNEADEQYINLVQNIISRGELKDNRTGVKAYSLPHQTLHFNVGDEFPLLTTKFVDLKKAVSELLWIWQDKSNNVDILKSKYGISFWDPWKRKDGTIGEAYGAQLNKKYKYMNIDQMKVLELKKSNKINDYRVGKNGEVYMDQVDKLIYDLHVNPNSRRMVVSLWNVEDLHNMALEPCAFLTEWNVTKGKLNLLLNIRSSDVMVGLPYNIAQYAFLLQLMAQTSGFKVGWLTVMINDAHIYENHLSGAMTQITNDSYLSPSIKINKDVKGLYDFRVNDVIMNDYVWASKIKFPVAI